MGIVFMNRQKQIFFGDKPTVVSLIITAIWALFCLEAFSAEPGILSNACVSGIIAGQENPLAVINGESLREGESLGGIKVIAIETQGVRLQYQENTFYNALGDGCTGIIPSVSGQDIKSGFSSLFDSVTDSADFESFEDMPFGDQGGKIPMALGGLAFTVMFILWGLAYAYVAVCLQLIARKSRTKHAWFAWVPVLNLFLMCMIARKSFWFVLLLCIPFINIIAILLLWMGIAQARNKPAWLGILMLVPFVNVIVLGYLAFSKEDIGSIGEEDVSVQEEPQAPSMPGPVDTQKPEEEPPV
jgi:hypothetical protein